MALIRLLDDAIAIPIQQHFHELTRELAKSIQGTQKELKASTETLSALYHRMDKTSDIDADELSRLKTQRRLLDVELAGLRARVEAAQTILEKIRGEEQVSKLLDIKIMAEIDIAGVAARRQALDGIIAEGTERRRMQKEIDNQRAKNGRLEKSINRKTGMLQRSTLALEVYSDLFALKDSKVKIMPIEWTE